MRGRRTCLASPVVSDLTLINWQLNLQPNNSLLRSRMTIFARNDRRPQNGFDL